MLDQPKIPATSQNFAFEGRVGLELEFAGLDEETAAYKIGEVTGVPPRKDGVRWLVPSSTFGTIEIYIDTKLAKTVDDLAGEAGLAALRSVVPVEVVTEPFAVRDLVKFDAITSALRSAGARGSRDGLLFGFGLHLNVETDPDDVASLYRTVAAYALIEDNLRARDPIDVSRRLLPFVSPYPDRLINALCMTEPETLQQMTELFLVHAPSRDFGLDILPILALHDERQVIDAAEGLSKIKSRPAFQFRLPDCRIDEESWSVLRAWDSWGLVQAVASDDELLATLKRARQTWSHRSPLFRPPWFRIVEDILYEPASEVLK